MYNILCSTYHSMAHQNTYTPTLQVQRHRFRRQKDVQMARQPWPPPGVLLLLMYGCVCVRTPKKQDARFKILVVATDEYHHSKLMMRSVVSRTIRVELLRAWYKVASLGSPSQLCEPCRGALTPPRAPGLSWAGWRAGGHSVVQRRHAPVLHKRPPAGTPARPDQSPHGLQRLG